MPAPAISEGPLNWPAFPHIPLFLINLTSMFLAEAPSPWTLAKGLRRACGFSLLSGLSMVGTGLYSRRHLNLMTILSLPIAEPTSESEYSTKRITIGQLLVSCIAE